MSAHKIFYYQQHFVYFSSNIIKHAFPTHLFGGLLVIQCHIICAAHDFGLHSVLIVLTLCVIDVW